jgi:hypothetical protein
MYDVITTMKDKEVIKGILKVEGLKDQTKIMTLANEFEKNLLTGETKVKLSTELDYDGKKVKHESQTEFTMQGCHGSRHHGFMKHLHHHHHHHDHHCGEHQDDLKGRGLKGKLTKLAFVLSILNQIKAEEKEDKSVILSLDIKEIPDEIKEVCRDRISQRPMSEAHQHHGFMKEFLTLQDPTIKCNLWISKNREIEKISVTVGGKQINELNENHDLNLKAELSLFS